MDALLATAQSLRSLLQSAAQELGDDSLYRNLSLPTSQDVGFALDHTFVIRAGVEPFPRRPWSCETSIAHGELVHHVIERLLARKRVENWEDANVLTLGYREVTPGAAGHRVAQSNGVMCYYPNTLVAALKKPLWESLHRLMGDDLLTHLLLNYTIVVQLKETSLSYMQLTGKSLRQQKRLGDATATLKREVSINHVMYARHFRKDRVFASSHALVKASKTGEPISRTEASRVLGSIFPDTAGGKHLPKRLINLIPTIQEMVTRFKAFKVEELARKLIPVHAGFRKFMAGHPNIKRMLAEKTADGDAEATSRPILLPIVRKALDDGYSSQSEVVAPSCDRKRKRREEAIEMLSHASVGTSKAGNGLSAPVGKKTKKTVANPGDRVSRHSTSDLAKLQQHKEDIKTMLTFVTPKKKIYRLVRKLLAGVVPKELWGSSDTKKNWKYVKSMLRKLIFPRKFDIFSLKKCAEEFQVTRVEWMNTNSNAEFCPPNERVKRQQLFEDVLRWVISSLIFPLLRKPRKLYQVLKKAIQEDEYLIRKHWVGHQVAPISDSDESLPSSSFFFKLERPAYPSGELLGFEELAAQSKKENAMFVDGVLYDYLTKAKALELLKEHLSTNVVQVDGRDYVQRCGIPQGSVLSTTLCNMYYAHFERRVLGKRLPEVCDPAIVPVSCCQHEGLFRYTDDFMFITTDLKRARRFVAVMHEGNEEFGCFVNVAKSQANFAATQGLPTNAPGSECISWCGMLIDATNLQLYVNYEKLSSSLLQASIPFNETKAAQEFFVTKVVSAIRQRWHALYFDPELLSEDTIRVNLFQMQIVAAHRFTILIEMLPFVNRDMHFFHECIHRIPKKMTKGIHRSLELAAQPSSGLSLSSYHAQKHQVWTIGLRAFQLMIQAKTSNAQRKQQCKWVDWQKLLDAIQSEQKEFKQQEKKTRSTGPAFDFAWLMSDRRNASMLKRCLGVGSVDRTVDEDTAQLCTLPSLHAAQRLGLQRDEDLPVSVSWLDDGQSGVAE
ncbi:hypothetical protein PRIC2_002061 [Phytophthora ramorum]